MSLLHKFKQTNTLRWFFFGIGIIAVVALTGMNIYSLYALRESTIDSAKETNKTHLEEFTEQVRYRFYRQFWEINKLDMEQLELSWEASGNFPESFKTVLSDAVDDSLFSDIHYIPSGRNGCRDDDKPIYKYNASADLFTIAVDVPNIVCDGVGISKSSIKAMLSDYRWNNSVTFDAHRSMTLALIDLNDRTVVGHLNFIIDRDYLIEGFLKPKIVEQFAPTDQTGFVVWLRDWMQNEILASSDETFEYDRDAYQIDIRQRFPDMLDNWSLHASFLESPAVAASNASLTRNLIVLGIAVFVLSGALMFMFINAQRERELAQRQAGFLANITHELKTPLAVMQAAGENIADGRVTDGERLKSYGDHIYHEAVRLRKMIEKLLDVAKVDSGQILAETAPQRPAELVEEFYNANRPYIQNKGFEFTLDIQKSLPLVMIDPDHLETIISNLVENAVKYSSDRKKIELNVRKSRDTVLITVKDYGDGIPKKSQKHIFDKFYRVENALTAKTKGHGLGLAIVKNLVEINGGKINVESEPGKGSLFSVHFPSFINTPEEHVKPADVNKKRSKNIPYVDEYV